MGVGGGRGLLRPQAVGERVQVLQQQPYDQHVLLRGHEGLLGAGRGRQPTARRCAADAQVAPCTWISSAACELGCRSTSVGGSETKRLLPRPPPATGSPTVSSAERGAEDPGPQAAPAWKRPRRPQRPPGRYPFCLVYLWVSTCWTCNMPDGRGCRNGNEKHRAPPCRACSGSPRAGPPHISTPSISGPIPALGRHPHRSLRATSLLLCQAHGLLQHLLA